MKFVIDAFGGDYAPAEIVKGAVESLKESGVSLILTGDKTKLLNELKNYSYDQEKVEIVHAPDIVTNDDIPTAVIRNKPESSLVKALNILKERPDADAMISAGNTGAILTGGLFIIGRIDGIERPALAPALPTMTGKFVCLIDSGANADCLPLFLAQFALMGASYMQTVYNVENPKVALVSVGVEDKKGNQLSKEAFKILKTMPINFVGNMEAREALSGDYDVLVCDGFTGNVLLKTIEGTAKNVMEMLSQNLKKNAPKDVDLSFVKKSFGQALALMDFNSNGGAQLMGLNKTILKVHGAANSNTIINAVNQAVQMVNGKFIEKIKEKIKNFKGDRN